MMMGGWETLIVFGCSNCTPWHIHDFAKSTDFLTSFQKINRHYLLSVARIKTHCHYNRVHLPLMENLSHRASSIITIGWQIKISRIPLWLLRIPHVINVVGTLNEYQMHGGLVSALFRLVDFIIFTWNCPAVGSHHARLPRGSIFSISMSIYLRMLADVDEGRLLVRVLL